MKVCIILTIIVCGCCSIFFQRCSAGPEAASATETYPIPSTRSIIPLQIGNHWTYHFTLYDSSGAVVPLPNRALDLEITRIFRRTGVDTLEPVDPFNGEFDSTDRYIYCYEWEHLDNGYLISHVESGELDRRGLYIVGTFVGDTVQLFPEARLWYAYPRTMAGVWTIDIPGGDTALSVVECVSNVHSEYVASLDGGSPSPLRFLDSCYLFRRTIGEHKFYHCFHPDYGEISMRHYINGKLNDSYVLVAQSLLPW